MSSSTSPIDFSSNAMLTRRSSDEDLQVPQRKSFPAPIPQGLTSTHPPVSFRSVSNRASRAAVPPIEKSLVSSSTQPASILSLPTEEIDRMLSIGNLSNILQFSWTNFKIEAKGPSILLKLPEKKEQLDNGGTKRILMAELNDEPVALAIFGGLDGPEIIAQKWRAALQEPQHINTLRQLGMVVNDRCEILLVKINGYDFPAIIMKPYLHHDFEIHDRKNYKSNPISEFDWKSITDDEQMVTQCSESIKDIVTLAKNHVNLDGDSVNLAIKEGAPRLFINDLGNYTLSDQNQTSEAIVATLVMFFIDAFTRLAHREQPNPGATTLDRKFAPYMASIKSNDKFEHLMKEQVANEWERQEISPSLDRELLHQKGIEVGCIIS